MHKIKDLGNVHKHVNISAASLSADEGSEQNNVFEEDALLGTGVEFLDPRYRLLDKLTPTATQNRLSYLVELVLDKCRKRISDEAIKVRLRKDAAAFGAADMPVDVRGISRFLGARTLKEVTRHRCGNNECSFTWIGAVPENHFDFNDCCPECGTTRYIREGKQVRPRRVFYYFGAANAVEALHRHPIFKKNWKQNIDVTLNAYRSSPDATRLNTSTGGEALASHNGLYISMADDFQSHKSKTQSIIGENVSLNDVDCIYMIKYNHIQKGR